MLLLGGQIVCFLHLARVLVHGEGRRGRFVTSVYVVSSQDGEVTVDEFKKAIQNNCTGKAYGDFPKAFKAFIEGLFRTVDIDGICKERKVGLAHSE